SFLNPERASSLGVGASAQNQQAQQHHQPQPVAHQQPPTGQVYEFTEQEMRRAGWIDDDGSVRSGKTGGGGSPQPAAPSGLGIAVASGEGALHRRLASGDSH